MSVYYSDDLVTLHHGDCVELTDWLTADVLVTDPPYGQQYQSGQWGRNANGQTISNDHSTFARDQVLAIWGKRPAIVFGNWRVDRPQNVRHRLLWHKQGRFAGVIGNNELVPWFPVDEEIYVLGSGFVGPPTPNVIATKENRSQHATKIGHPTPKPLVLMETLIGKAPKGTIADPFAGSGATLLAARNLGRRVIGVEIEERYCELIANRLAQGVLL